MSDILPSDFQSRRRRQGQGLTGHLLEVKEKQRRVGSDQHCDLWSDVIFAPHFAQTKELAETGPLDELSNKLMNKKITKANDHSAKSSIGTSNNIYDSGCHCSLRQSHKTQASL